ncbi:hypothetical protein [Nannocystis pusilla]|uniref:hypothetical protein n=1 Tax=Nannocystis pusilla TaxID=889268 RepID=UPI003B7B980F
MLLARRRGGGRLRRRTRGRRRRLLRVDLDQQGDAGGQLAGAILDGLAGDLHGLADALAVAAGDGDLDLAGEAGRRDADLPVVELRTDPRAQAGLELDGVDEVGADFDRRGREDGQDREREEHRLQECQNAAADQRRAKRTRQSPRRAAERPGTP